MQDILYFNLLNLVTMDHTHLSKHNSGCVMLLFKLSPFLLLSFLFLVFVVVLASYPLLN